MNIQDRKKSLTAEELRQRYNLEDISKNKKAIQMQKDELVNTNEILNNFVEATTQNLQELQDQVDGNITTWFYSGVPTLSNEPAVEWTTDDEKINHLGDLYYDQNTGYAYRWAYIDSSYVWTRIVDADVVEALAVANAAQDTADSKRRVFVVQPTPPYDIGDIWIKDDTDLYRCRTATVQGGTYNPSHWILATNYTDDTVALAAQQALNEFKTEVQEGYVSNATLETTVNSINGRVEEVYTYTTTVESAVNNITSTAKTLLGDNDLNATDALEENAINYYIDGSTNQNVYQGNQLIDFNNPTSVSTPIDYSFVNDTVSVIANQSGTYLSKGWTITDYIKANPGKTVSFNYETLTKSNRSGNIVQLCITQSGTTTYPKLVNANGEKFTYTIPSDTSAITKVEFAIYANNSSTSSQGSVVMTKPMLQFGTEEKEYEPYVGRTISPNASYPQEIKNIASIKNLLDISNIEGGTVNGLTTSYDETINLDGTTTSSGFILPTTTSTGVVLPAGTYKVNAFIKEGTINLNNHGISIELRNSSSTVLSTLSITQLISGADISNQITLSQATEIYLDIYINSSNVVLNDVKIGIQVEKGTVAHEFVPYGNYAKVKITGKNMIDIDNIYSPTSTSNLTRSFVNGIITLTWTNSFNLYLLHQNRRYIKLDKNKTYTFSFEHKGDTLNLRLDENTNILNTNTDSDYTKYEYTFTNLDEIELKFIRRANTGTAYIRNFQLEEKETSSDYEEYKEKITLIDLGNNELCQIGDYKDSLSIVNGKVSIDKRVGKVILDGTESSIGLYATMNKVARFVVNNAVSNVVQTEIKSNYFKWYSNQNRNVNFNNTDNDNEAIHIRDDLSGIGIKIDKTIAPDVATFRTWLGTHNTEIYYPLATASTITLPDTNIPLFNGINHIILVDDLITSTSITYYRITPLSNSYALQIDLNTTNNNLQNTASELERTNENINSNYYTKGQIDDINTETTTSITEVRNDVQTKISPTDLNIAIEQVITNGVNQVNSQTGYTFDRDGLKIEKSNEDVKSILDNDGLLVSYQNEEKLKVNSSGVETENITTRKFYVQKPIRMEKTKSVSNSNKNGLGFFWIGE